MALEWEQLNVDAADPVALGRWWTEALGWVVVNDDPGEFEIRPDKDTLPGLIFAQVPEGKTVKNRLHMDFRPDDRDAEVARLLALGARHVDVGQGDDVPWVTLADPEGNEFCVLSSRRR
ncbi:VOC family protein [Streptomyces spinosirectus]|jgi:hypothetical protein|uniref:VOC family protein n=1 Tax=Streptomyces TaxID=1883 RepID=UPI000D391600|nr:MULTISPECIES: VOC family protein [Streptomyces]MBY8339540.1 VOC family protein [Streptomyces plumbidurans]UIR15935.1 VOC family protein [Streptomyces spinosirectus]